MKSGREIVKSKYFWFVSICLVFTLFAMVGGIFLAYAALNVEVGHDFKIAYTPAETPLFSFSLKSDNTYELSGFNKNYNGWEDVTEITIPNTYQDISVTSIGDYAFGGWGEGDGEKLEKLIFGDNGNIMTIGEGAFLYCDQLKTVDFGANSNLQTIGPMAFWGCGFEDISIPGTVTVIEGSAFDDCDQLISVDFGSNSCLEMIGSQAFESCKSLQEIIIPKSVREIEGFAFASCENIETVTFEDNSNIELIDSNAFSNCHRLQTIDFGKNSSLQTIGEGVFYECRFLRELVIPANVTEIGDEALPYTLINLTFEDGSKLTAFNKSQFSGYDYLSLKTINFGSNNNIETIEENAFQEFIFLETVIFGANSKLNSIGDRAFYELSQLKTIDFGTNSSLQSIGTQAFAHCTSLQEFTIPASVTEIGNAILDQNNEMSMLTIENAAIYDEIVNNTPQGGTIYSLAISSISLPYGLFSLFSEYDDWYETYPNVRVLTSIDDGRMAGHSRFSFVRKDNEGYNVYEYDPDGGTIY